MPHNTRGNRVKTNKQTRKPAPIKKVVRKPAKKKKS